MTADDLERVLRWRNHPEVRRYMYTTQEIGLDEHRRWFERASQDASRHLLVYESGGVPLGFVSFQSSACGAVADWGFYAAPDAPRGMGRQLGQAALRYAFSQAGLHKVCGQALAFNQRSITFHLKQGFRQEGILRDQHFDGQSYHDVVCFGLLAAEWQANLRESRPCPASPVSASPAAVSLPTLRRTSSPNFPPTITAGWKPR